MNKLFLMFFFFILVCKNSYSKIRIIHAYKINKNVSKKDTDNTISSSTANQMIHQASKAINALETLLNNVTSNSPSPSELIEYINNSFNPNKNDRLFLNNNVIIESDINPKFSLAINKEVTIEKYLKELDLSYGKTDEFSIKFSNMNFSAVKKTDHIFIRVKYDQSFGSTFKDDGKIYPYPFTRQREATIIIVPDGKDKWKAFIEAIAFYNPKLSIDNKDHNMSVNLSLNPNNLSFNDEKPIFKNDVTEIKLQAEGIIKTFESVLNSITFNDNSREEFDAYKKNSYSPDQRSQVFLNENILVESDVNPKYSLGNNKILTLKSYLNDLDSSYQKTGDFSIKLSNILCSNVKKNVDPHTKVVLNYYIKVKYRQVFGSKFKDNSSYPMRDREARIRVDKVGVRKWKALIESIKYFDPSLPIEGNDNNASVTPFNLTPSAKVHQLITTLVQNAK